MPRVEEEIPWFAEFGRKYAYQGLAVVGVSLNAGGVGRPRPRRTRVRCGPLVRLFQPTQDGGRRGVGCGPGGPPHIADFLNKLLGRETSGTGSYRQPPALIEL
jgi:hypothetical protein